MPIERLSDADARILAAEQGNVRGHTLKVIVGEGDALDLDELRGQIAARIHLVPALRKRLQPSPLGLGNPALVDDPSFHVENHVNYSPARELDEAGLRMLASLLMSRPLDRRRPLWNATVVRHLAGGGFAIVFKIHHAIADGMSSVKLLSELLIDPEPSHSSAPEAPWSPSTPGQIELLRWAAGGAARSAAARSAALAGAAAALPRTRPAQAGATLATLRRELARARADSPFDSSVGPIREVTWVDVPLDDVKAVAHAHSGHTTVNDVVLSLTAAGIRRWLLEHEQDPGPIRVQVPVSLHRPDEGAALGNRDSAIFVPLPLQEADPVRRLSLIADATGVAKREHDAETLESFFGNVGRLSRSAERWARRWAGHPRVFGVNVSNVPGPQGPHYILGRPLRALHSMAEVGERHVLRVSAMSAAGRLSFGLCSDQVVVGGLEPITVGITDELEALTGDHWRPPGPAPSRR